MEGTWAPYKCSEIEALGKEYCAHDEVESACCFCGGGFAGTPAPTPIPGPCENMAMDGIWSHYTCAGIEPLGAEYCAHMEVSSACCFCGGGQPVPEPEPEPEPEPAPPPSLSPTPAFQCIDSADWYVKQSSKNCAWTGGLVSRCGKKGSKSPLRKFTGWQACQKTCARDDPLWSFKKDANDCAWTQGKASRCSRKGKGSPRRKLTGYEACAVTCGGCGTRRLV